MGHNPLRTVVAAIVKSTRVIVEIHLPEVLKSLALVLVIFSQWHPSLRLDVWHFCATREIEGQRLGLLSFARNES